MERNGSMVLATSGRALTVDEIARCETRAASAIFAFSPKRVAAVSQYLTGGLVSFALGLNDTPKIAGILVAALGILNLAGMTLTHASGVPLVIGSVASAMLLGGALFAGRVAKTMSEETATIDSGQGLLTSAVTAFLVLLASFDGLPVSTTHVAVGALFGIGLANGSARLKTLGTIATAWVTTLPLAAVLAMGAYLALSV